MAAGLCLVASLGAGALTATGAGAAAPEFQLCAKAPHKSGKYSSSTCTESSFVAAGGQRFELEGFPWTQAKKRSFKVTGHGTAVWTLLNPVGKGGGPSEPAEVVLQPKCFETRLGPSEGARGFGEMTGPKTVVWSETYKECSVVQESWKCKNGTRKAYINTEQLEGTLVWADPSHSAVDLRVKGLGPGGLLVKYECPAAHLHVAVYGEYLAELSRDIGSASKTASVIAKEGALDLQEPMYEEDAFSEGQGKEVLEYDYALESCENGEAPYPAGTKTEAECVSLVGPEPAAPPPVTLLAEDSALGHKRLPMTQNTTTTHKGEPFLVAGS